MVKFEHLIVMTISILSSFRLLTQGNDDHWLQEIKKNIKENTNGTCNFVIKTMKDFNTIPSEYEGKEILFSSPSAKELQSFKETPDTFTKGKLDVGTAYLKQKLNVMAKKAHVKKWQYPSDHPAQNVPRCLNATMMVGTGGISQLYSPYKTPQRASYLLRGKQGLVHPHGYVGFDCGFYQSVEGCATRVKEDVSEWYGGCQKYLSDYDLAWDSLWWGNSSYSAKQKKANSGLTYSKEIMRCHCSFDNVRPRKVPKLFLATALWDDNFARFMMDGVSRIARYLPFLRKNKDIFVHIKADGNSPAAQLMRDTIFSFLDIDPSRIVKGTILADEVFVPRATSCSFVLNNPLEYRLAAQELLAGAKKDYMKRNGLKSESELNLDNRQKQIVIMQRDQSASADGQNNVVRGKGWNNKTLSQLHDSFTKHFKDHKLVFLKTSSYKYADYCASCEMIEYAKTDILVGTHGAGLSNMIFMKPNSIVVEISADFNTVTMPLCGYTGMQCAVFGLHHFLYNFERFSGNNKAGKKIYEPTRTGEGYLSLSKSTEEEEFCSESDFL